MTDMPAVTPESAAVQDVAPSRAQPIRRNTVVGANQLDHKPVGALIWQRSTAVASCRAVFGGVIGATSANSQPAAGAIRKRDYT